MWFIIKIVATIVAFVTKLIARFVKPDYGIGVAEDWQGVQLHTRTLSNKQRITETRFGIEFNCHSVFKLTKESGADHFFKLVGISDELQTGDTQFDQKIYVASDNEAFRFELSTDAKTRKSVLELFEKGCTAIRCDGKTMWFFFPNDQRGQDTIKRLCVDLFRQVSDLEKSSARFIDRFALKILLVEATIWSLSIYSVSSAIEFFIFKEDVHLDVPPLLMQGLFFGAIAALVLFGFIVVFLRGSSRGHRILIESFIVLILGLPMGGIASVSDINTQMDKTEPVVFETKVTDTYRLEHRGRRGRRYYTYHMTVERPPAKDWVEIPGHIQITGSLFGTLTKGSTVRISVGRGHLKHPWFRSIELTR